MDPEVQQAIDTLRERAGWYLEGCPHLEDGDHYWRSGDLRRDVHDDLVKALDIAAGEHEARKQAEVNLLEVQSAWNDENEKRRDAEEDLEQALRERDEAREARKQAEQIVANVNNSVFGSQGYFTSPDCVEQIETLKFNHNKAIRERDEARITVDKQAYVLSMSEFSMREKVWRLLETGVLVLNSDRELVAPTGK